MTASVAISPCLNSSPRGVLCLFLTEVCDPMGRQDLPALQTDFLEMHATRRLDPKQRREAAPRGEELHFVHVDLFEVHNGKPSVLTVSSNLQRSSIGKQALRLQEQLT